MEWIERKNDRRDGKKWEREDGLEERKKQTLSAYCTNNKQNNDLISNIRSVCYHSIIKFMWPLVRLKPFLFIITFSFLFRRNIRFVCKFSIVGVRHKRNWHTITVLHYTSSTQRNWTPFIYQTNDKKNESYFVAEPSQDKYAQTMISEKCTPIQTDRALSTTQYTREIYCIWKWMFEFTLESWRISCDYFVLRSPFPAPLRHRFSSIFSPDSWPLSPTISLRSTTLRCPFSMQANASPPVAWMATFSIEFILFCFDKSEMRLSLQLFLIIFLLLRNLISLRVTRRPLEIQTRRETTHRIYLFRLTDIYIYLFVASVFFCLCIVFIRRRFRI